MFKMVTYKARLKAAADSEVGGSFTLGYLEEFEKLVTKTERYPAVVAIWPKWNITNIDRESEIEQIIFFGVQFTTSYEASIDLALNYAKDFLTALNANTYLSVPGINSIQAELIPQGQTTDKSVWIMIKPKIKLYCEP